MLTVQIVDIVVLGLFSPVILNSQMHFRLLTGVPSTLNAVSQVSVMIFMGELVDFPALEFSGKTKTCWCESGGGPQKWPEEWNVSHAQKGWGAGVVPHGKGSREILLKPLSTEKGNCRFHWSAMYICTSVLYENTEDWRRHGARTQPPFPPHTDNIRPAGCSKGTLQTSYSEWETWAFDFPTHW